MYPCLAISCLPLILLGLLADFKVVNGETRLNLKASRRSRIWTAENGNSSISVAAQVPGGIYSDLESAGIFSSRIYYRYNDIQTKWVGRENWSFTRNFSITSEFAKLKKILVVCKGLDTVGSVEINGVSVGRSTNMFVRYMFDVKDHLREGNNTVRVRFQSPVEYALEEWNLQNLNYTVPPQCVPSSYNGECHANHIRKMQASFSWDWGPAYPSSGIYKDIYLEGLNGAVVRDSLLFVEPNSNYPDESPKTLWNVTAKVFLQVADPYEPGIITFRIRVENRKIYRVKRAVILKNKDEEISLTLEIPGNMVKLWWPNGYGKQPLYTAVVMYTSNNYGESSKKVMKAGFRKVELVEEPIDKDALDKGLTFFFRVNGVPIYAKGSNVIPMHVLSEKVTRGMTEWIIESAIQTHTNMIRIWGGGIYETDLIYELADKYGIMIWQDFMFACAMYPTNDKFIENVKAEVETQVKRLHYHPSIVLWAANNENEAALRGDWYGTSGNFQVYAKDYVKLYIGTVMGTLKKFDTSRNFLSSSPTNGKESEAEGWIAKNPYSNLYGDVHFYNYFADSWTDEIYPKTRFASEYGFQSWPHPFTLESVIDKDIDAYWGSAMMNHRQHLPGGETTMKLQIDLHLPTPKNFKDPAQFSNMMYLSQIAQAVAIKTETETYRRLKGQMFPDGTGQNMGALYWQLNDIWPGASWASIDSVGRWKMLHYYARNFFAPIIISPYKLKNGDVEIYLVSDRLEKYEGQMRIRLFSLESLTPRIDYEVTIAEDNLSAGSVHVILASKLRECGNLISTCLLYFSARDVPDNFLFLEYPKDRSVIQNPKLEITDIRPLAQGNSRSTVLAVTLQTEAVTPFVFLNFKPNDVFHMFDDNGFIMVESIKTVYFSSKTNVSISEFQSNLEIVSLYDVVK